MAKRRLSTHEAVVLSGYNAGFGGPLLVPFMFLHKDVQSRMGGDAIPVNLYSDEKFQLKLREAYYDDVVKIIPKVSQDSMEKFKKEESE